MLHSLSNMMLRKRGSSALRAQDVFAVSLFTGNGGSQTINNGINLLGSGGLAWLKARGPSPAQHVLFDTARGSTFLGTDTTAAEIAVAGFTANSNGFTVPNLYGGGFTIAAPTFRRAPKFFDIVTWTGDGTNNRVIPHSLGTTPGMIVIKDRGASTSWLVWHRSLPTGYVLFLNTQAGQDNYSSRYSPAPNASSFGVGTVVTGGGDELNRTSRNYVAYVFAHDTQADGIIQCGAFTGTAAVNLGWKPQFLLLKSVDTGDWIMMDTARGWSASVGQQLYANSGATEVANGASGGPTSTGFSYQNGGGGTFMYLAIREPTL